ncbi:MAG: hypothetical protein A2293_02765 [Elusimicrobia bacterium RIFOXYB2_FULL_49_7]|nr:MAG: hypothetical protein A2293_02765 [Elusimicrobia bacterium RIFOXYB2_FULL_49_7]
MKLDCHIHILEGKSDRADFRKRLKASGLDGGVLISPPPPCFPTLCRPQPAEVRLKQLLFWTTGAPHLYPFFWVDPLEKGALHQVDKAAVSGVSGFKIICDHFPPGHPKAMAVYRRIASHNKPILFHSGILWDGKSSSSFNRPGEFEALLEIDRLRFALAHLAWPWCDELIAVYGKFQSAYALRKELSVEMFMDITPGTPPLFRQEALTKLLKTGYDVENNVMFGSDCRTNVYNNDWTLSWLSRDRAIYRKLRIPARIVSKIHGENLLRFLGLKKGLLRRTGLRPGEY